MKKLLITLSIIFLLISLIGGIYLGYNYISQNKQQPIIENITPIPSLPTETNTNKILYKPSPFKEPAKISINTSFSQLNFKLIKKTWEYKISSNVWSSYNENMQFNSKENKLYSSDETIAITYDYNPDSILINVYDNNTNECIYTQYSIDDTIPIMDKQGDYTYIVTIIWNEPACPYRGTYIYEFDLFINLPSYFEVNKSLVVQGDMIKISAFNIDDDEVPVLNQSIFSKFKFFKQGYTYVGYIPAGYYTNAGTYEIEYGILGKKLKKQIITVKAYDFNIQYLWIDKTIAASTKNEQSSAEYVKYFVPVRQHSNESTYYSKPFVIPAYGHLSTEYGENRYTNGIPTSYHHSGLDIGNVKGSPIYATNRGKVVLSMFLIMTGNTIVIDHGQGLFSVYFHMDSLIAQKDEIVERKQQIGYMGTTGFSTGPHLHFTMSYYDTNIEPGYILVGEPITRKNYKKYLTLDN